MICIAMVISVAGQWCVGLCVLLSFMSPCDSDDRQTEREQCSINHTVNISIDSKHVYWHHTHTHTVM